MNSALLIFAIVGAYPLGPNFAAGPSHWNADVHAPQAFYPTELPLIAERSIDMRDCNLPDVGPNIYAYYFFANWCGDCVRSSQIANDLEKQRVNVIRFDAGTDNGARSARTFGVKSVPYWIVFSDGEKALETNDPRKVVSYISDHKPRAAGQRTYPVSAGTVYAPDGSRAPIGYRIGACITDGNGNCVTPMQYGQPVYYQQAGFWQRGPARRWLSNRGGWISNGNHPILRFLFRRRG